MAERLTGNNFRTFILTTTSRLVLEANEKRKSVYFWKGNAGNTVTLSPVSPAVDNVGFVLTASEPSVRLTNHDFPSLAREDWFAVTNLATEQLMIFEENYLD